MEYSYLFEHGLEKFGVNLAFFVLGMAGGFVRSIMHDKVKIRQGLVNIIVGGIIANYTTHLISKKLGVTDKETYFTIAVVIGFFGMGILTILEGGEKWAKDNPRSILSFFINSISNLLKSGSGKKDKDVDANNNNAND